MSILAWIEDQKRLKLLNAPKYVNPASDSSKGLWTRCDKCGVILYIKHLKENQRVCFGCSYHLQMSSQERVENLLDKDSWRPLDETVSPCDPLEFHDQKDYTDRLQEAQERTGLQDAIQTGSGMVDGIPIALGVMDFDFMGGSMGSVVGEKVTRLIEYATQEGLTLVLVCASGGARMQEGVFSLMQMAKISSALQVYQGCANLLYISILTSPTTGGVTASFAMLGDIIFAEPKALVAFAGRRVIEQTLCEDLPEDFQTSEYMLHHGLLDLIVPRRFFRQALSESIRLYKNAPFKKPGRIPFGVQNPITFLIEERIRRRWAAGNAPIADKMSHLWTESKSKNSAGAPTPKTPGAGRSQEVAETARGSRKNRGVSTPGETTPTELQGKESNPESTVLNRNGSTKTVSPAYAQEGARTSASLESKQGSKPLQGVSTPGISTPGVSTTSVGGLGGIIDEEEAQTGDKNKQTDNVETPPLAQTQEKLAFKHATQSTESASVDTSLQNEDLARSAAAVSARKSFQNDATFSVSNPLDPARDRPLLQREAIDYRNILTSFQTMFNLFSKELVVPYASAYANNTRLDEQQGDENISGINQGKNPEPQSEQTPYETNSEDWKANSPQEVANFSGVSAPDTSAPDLLLHKFFILSENQNSNQVELLHTQTSDGDCGDTTAKLDSKSALQTSVGDLHGPKTKVEDVSSETPSSTRAREDASYPSTSGASVSTSSHSAALQKTTADISMPTSGTGSQTMEPLLPRRLSVYRDVLPSPGTNKELVGSSSIYVDFLNQSIELAATESVEWRAFYLHQRISQTTGFVEDLAQSLPDYPKHSNEIAFQNMLFYRSICRKLS